MFTSFHEAVFTHFLRNSTESIRTIRATFFFLIFYQTFSQMRKNCVKSDEFHDFSISLHRETKLISLQNVESPTSAACGARCRNGHPCKAKAVINPKTDALINNRCRMHGGLSCGPKTLEGKARSREAARTGILKYWQKKKSEMQ